MDDLHAPFRSSRASDFTLCEMDDVLLSELVLLQELSRPDMYERAANQKSAATVPCGRSANLSATPWEWPDSNLSAHHEPNLSNFQQPCENSSTSANLSQISRVELSWSGPQGTAAYTPLPARTLHEEKKSARNHSETLPARSRSRTPPSEMSFLESNPGDATVTYLGHGGKAQSIARISVQAIAQSCPLLATAFESRTSGPQLHLEILNEATALPFLRFLYTGSYAVDVETGDVYEDVPTSLLLHCQLYHLGHLYDLDALMKQANVNIIRQCEFACSSPDKPIHLSMAIEYAYEHLRGHASVLDTIISYCVSCFLVHRLAEDAEFKLIAFELRAFHQALCRESMDRQFENETASAIIRMPFKRETPDFYLSREDLAPLPIRNVAHTSVANAKARVAINEKRLETHHPALKMRSLLALRACQDRAKGAKIVPEGSKQSNATMWTEEVIKAPGSITSPSPRDGLSRHRKAVFRGQSPRKGDFVFPDTGAAAIASVQGSSSGDAILEDSADFEPASDSDYEIVELPAYAGSLSSEGEANVEVLDDSKATHAVTTLPFRTRSIASLADSFEDSDSFSSAGGLSESEWSLV